MRGLCNGTCKAVDSGRLIGLVFSLDSHTKYEWRNLGPLGELHNITNHIFGSVQRRQYFKSLSENHLSLKRDNDTHWNSWYIVRSFIHSDHVCRYRASTLISKAYCYAAAQPFSGLDNRDVAMHQVLEPESVAGLYTRGKFSFPAVVATNLCA